MKRSHATFLPWFTIYLLFCLPIKIKLLSKVIASFQSVASHVSPFILEKGDGMKNKSWRISAITSSRFDLNLIREWKICKEQKCKKNIKKKFK